MERFIIQPEVVVTVLDFARGFPLSFFTLISLILLVVTMSTVIALRRYEMEKRRHVLHENPSAGQREAA